MNSITWADFEKVAMHVGTIIKVEDFVEAKKPAYKIWVDFGAAIGVKKTSAQVTFHYSKQDLLGLQIVGVINFEPKQIANFISEFLLTGFADENGNIIITTVQKPTPNGSRLM
ncbi:MAG: tRNA-binding protein [Candidatus Methylacidiphilales bacterium]